MFNTCTSDSKHEDLCAKKIRGERKPGTHIEGDMRGQKVCVVTAVAWQFSTPIHGNEERKCWVLITSSEEFVSIRKVCIGWCPTAHHKHYQTTPNYTNKYRPIKFYYPEYTKAFAGVNQHNQHIQHFDEYVCDILTIFTTMEQILENISTQTMVEVIVGGKTRDWMI